MALSEFLKLSEMISNIKKQEVPLPIAKKSAVVGPLRVGDDLSLRSSLVSPVNYDRDLTRLLYNHTEIIEAEGKPFVKENFEYFCATTSNIDKICLMWGLYKTTYETLGKRLIKCDKENCKTEFKEEILLDSLIQEDTFLPWEEDQPFHEFTFPIKVPYEGFIYLFNSRLPSIRDNNRLLSNISIEALQNTFQTIGALFSRAEQIALLVKSISIKPPKQDNAIETENLQEMLIALNNHVPHIVSEEFFKQYRNKFDKYYPKFYTMITCPECSQQIKFEVDLEIEFFRRSIFNRGEGTEEL